MKRFSPVTPLTWLLLAVLAVGLGPVLGARIEDFPLSTDYRGPEAAIVADRVSDGPLEVEQTMDTETKVTQAQEGDR